MVDEFAISAYETSVEACLHAENFAELLKSLSQLVSVMYVASDEHLDSPRRGEMTSYYLLYLICYTPSTSPHPNASDIIRIYGSLPDRIQSHPRVQVAMRVCRALHRDVDYVALRRVWEEESAERGFGMVFLKLLLPKIRTRVFTILSTSYYTYPESELRRALMLPDSNEFGTFVEDRFGKDGVEQRVVKGMVHLRVPKKRG
ncbi:hypothetical protein HK104_004119 [Borealophlyctis nickersoniae]|nr:hypothetical protein HK104_004119 [Borealophlyctis nickersoniae]